MLREQVTRKLVEEATGEKALARRMNIKEKIILNMKICNDFQHMPYAYKRITVANNAFDEDEKNGKGQ